MAKRLDVTPSADLAVLAVRFLLGESGLYFGVEKAGIIG